MAVCTLTIEDDEWGEYEDDISFKREKGAHVRGRLGGDDLDRTTIDVLKDLIALEGDYGRAILSLLGRYLYKVAFGDGDGGDGKRLGDAFEQTYDTYMGVRKPGMPPLTLRLVIQEKADDLATYPWEFLFMPQPERFVAEDSQLILTRYIPGVGEAAQPVEESKLRILIVLSQPAGGDRSSVAADKLIRQVRDLHSKRIEVIEPKSATREEIMREIKRTSPHIVHFIGHGRPGAIAFVKTEEDVAAARDELMQKHRSGDPEPRVDEADWGNHVTVCEALLTGLEPRERPGRIIFLHACDTATVPTTLDSLQGFTNVARELAKRDNVAAVVAMQYPIKAGDAQTFATKFYERIREGDALEEAVRQARRELGVRATGGGQAWNDRGFGTPVIYVRSGGPVFRPKAEEEVEEKQPEAHQARKLRCPYRCGQLVPAESGKCPNPSCARPYMVCPNACGGLVPFVAGGECTNCDFKLPVEATAAPATDAAVFPSAAGQPAARGITPPAANEVVPRREPPIAAEG